MKRFTILLALLLALFAGSPAFAQTSITTTTLSAAITSPSPTTKVIAVGSATGIAANGILFIDGEVFRVTAVSGTNITVLTQARPATHLTSATVYVVPVGAQIGLNPVGSCIRGTAGAFPAYSPFSLMFNLTTGEIATCRGNLGSRAWQITSPYATQISAAPPQTP